MKLHTENHCKKSVVHSQTALAQIMRELMQLKMLHTRKILIPDVPPPRTTAGSVRFQRGALIAGIGLCGLTGFIVVILLVL